MSAPRRLRKFVLSRAPECFAGSRLGGGSANGSGSTPAAPRLLASSHPSASSPPSRSWEREKPRLWVGREALGASGRGPRPPHWSPGSLPVQVLALVSTRSGRLESEGVCVGLRGLLGGSSLGPDGGAGIPGGAQAGECVCVEAAGVEYVRWGTPGGEFRGAGGRQAEAAPLPRQKTLASADREFATWRDRSERGSILPGQKEGMDSVGGWGDHRPLPPPPATELGQSRAVTIVGTPSRLGTAEPPLAGRGQQSG